MSSKDETIASMVDRVQKSKADTSRRYIDEILEKIQNSNREYYLAKFEHETKAFEKAMAVGQIQVAAHHQIMAEVYKSIAEKAFGASSTK